MDQTAIVVAIIGLAGIVLAALAGLGGALLGARIAAGATRHAATIAEDVARADRAEARRARFSDRTCDLAVELLEAVPNDRRQLTLDWIDRERGREPTTALVEPLAIPRLAFRLRMLLATPQAIESLRKLESSLDELRGMSLALGVPDEVEQKQWRALDQRFTAAVPSFEGAIQVELGSDL